MIHLSGSPHTSIQPMGEVYVGVAQVRVCTTQQGVSVLDKHTIFCKKKKKA